MVDLSLKSFFMFVDSAKNEALYGEWWPLCPWGDQQGPPGWIALGYGFALRCC